MFLLFSTIIEKLKDVQLVEEEDLLHWVQEIMDGISAKQATKNSRVAQKHLSPCPLAIHSNYEEVRQQLSDSLLALMLIDRY
jgi:hypothetical protein